MKRKILAVLMTGLVLLGTSATGVNVSAEEVEENGNKFYKVESGDTLSEIASLYGTDYLTLFNKNTNVVSDPHKIHVGMKLLVTGESATNPVIVAEAVPVETYQEPVYQETQPAQENSAVAVGGGSAKEWIAQKESGGSYTATNGHHIGRYQLDPSYLNGDHSVANQERVADEYVAGRYGSWENAQSFWINNGWY